jgi:hypothetical protein
MTNKETHVEKYLAFKREAEKEDIFGPLRVEAYFYALFHLINAVCAQSGIHIDKHQQIRATLERHNEIMHDMTEQVWTGFQEIENRLRPGLVYGGQRDNAAVIRAATVFHTVEILLLEKLDHDKA